MAKGKYKQSALKRIEMGNIEELTRKVEELTKEIEQLKKQADIDHATHAFQVAEMFEQVQEKSSEKVKALEEENLKLKRALRGELE